MYTALLLDDESRNKLINSIAGDLIHAAFGSGDQPSWRAWGIVAHHMTINMGSAMSGPAADLLGQQGLLKVVSYAYDDKVVAVGVETDIPSNNAVKHITVCVNTKGGGKPKDSNKLTNWVPVETPIQLYGTVVEL